MKFYIGSSFKNCGLVNYFSEKLEPNGWKYTYNLSKNINNDETIYGNIKSIIRGSQL